MVSFLASTFALVAGTAIAFAYGKRRPRGTQVSWGEALIAATFVFFMLFLAYGVWPNQWLLLADTEWKWRADTVSYVVRFWGRGQVIIPKEAMRDIVVSGIYGIALAGQVVVWVAWQKRGSRKVAEITPTSSYGRPLLKRV